MSAETPMIPVEEQVRIKAPGWPWDGRTGTILGAHPATGEHEHHYVVHVRYEDDSEIRYSLWHSQLEESEERHEREEQGQSPRDPEPARAASQGAPAARRRRHERARAHGPER